MQLAFLLSLGLRILPLLEYSVRNALTVHDETLAGLYAGNPQRTTNRPTAEKMLAAFKDILLTAIHHQDAVAYFLTPLSELQSHSLLLLGFDDKILTEYANERMSVEMTMGHALQHPVKKVYNRFACIFGTQN